MTRLHRQLTAAAAVLVFLATASAPAAEVADDDEYGVLVMAHGGTPEWNQGVLDAVEPLRARYPVEVAFGMADACSLQQAARELEAQGVERIGVVRLFVSGESWYERTEQILGLREGAPAPPAPGELPPECLDSPTGGRGDENRGAPGGDHSGHGDHRAPEGGHPANGHSGGRDDRGGDRAAGNHRMAMFRVDSDARFALTREGLVDAPEMGIVLADRARSLSRDPENEDVLILAHGPGDDAENDRWLAALDARADAVRAALPFHRVHVETLREDWSEKREEAEPRVRAFVAETAAEGRRAIVIPYRVFGFGPYAGVLDGLSYEADRRGLLPHVSVTDWIERQAEELRRAAF